MLRAWSDDLPALSLTCPNHKALFSELTPRIANLLKQQGFDSKIIREIHRFVIGYKQSNASSSDVRVARFPALEDISRACRSILTPSGRG